MFRGFQFEFYKLKKDHLRIIFGIFLVALSFFISCMLVSYFVYDDVGYNKGINQYYTKEEIDDANFQLEILNENLKFLNGEIENNYIIINKNGEELVIVFVYNDIEELNKTIKYYNRIIELQDRNKTVMYGYSYDEVLYTYFTYQQSRTNLPNYLTNPVRLYLYQDYISIFTIFILIIIIYYSFVKDKHFKFDKNYFQKNNIKLFLGKALFSETLILIIYIFFLLLGIVMFNNYETIRIFNGIEYIDKSVISIYFLRAIEFYILILSISFLFIFISLIKNRYLYFIICIILNALYSIPVFISTTNGVIINKAFPYIKYIPFVSVITSDSFYDKSFIIRMIYPLLLILLFIIYLIIKYINERKK